MFSLTQKYDLIILGSGPAGYTALIYALRANLNVAMINGNLEGGQLTTTSEVDNWIGSPKIQGPELMLRMKEHCQNFEANIINDYIHKVNLKSESKNLYGKDDNEYICKSLIIATGSNPQYLNIINEKLYLGKGVSTCAVCDGFFYKNKEVIVVGGGNTAVEEALYLSKIAKKVYLVHRRDKLRAEAILQNQFFKEVDAQKIKPIWNSVINNIIGDNIGVTGVQIENIQTNTKNNLNCFGLFIAIGHTPNSQIFKQLNKSQQGYILTNKSNSTQMTATNIPGVFAAGDVADFHYRQAITSAGSGCMAAIDAKNYLETQN